MAVFLASEKAAWITGEVYRVSGGMEGVSAAPPRAASLSSKRALSSARRVAAILT